MSSRIWIVGYMALLFKTLVLLFSATLVLSDQTVDSLKSFKLSENIIYDCIDIYTQPSLNHPLLKNHKIEMKPSVSFSGSEIKNQTISNNKIACPDGTVPILRNTKRNVSSAQDFEEMHFDPLQEYMSGVRVSSGPYRGVLAWSNLYELSIANDQASFAAIFVGTDPNYIQVGWMINPSVFGDQRVWSYGFWRGKDDKGCYNLDCPGFVQVSRIDPIHYPNEHYPDVRWYRFFIHQDEGSGNWWLTRIFIDGPSIDIGYWPKELFDLINDGAQIAGAGGFTQASLSGVVPPMGNGNLPSEHDNYTYSAIFTNVEVVDHKYQQQRIDSTYVTVLINGGPKCYGLRYGNFKKRTDLGFFFNYGGPGGNSCPY